MVLKKTAVYLFDMRSNRTSSELNTLPILIIMKCIRTYSLMMVKV
jgi:hypothetical protein